MEIKRERDLVEFRVAALAFAADDLGSKETHTRVESARRRAPNSSGVSHDDQTPQVSTFYVLRWVLSDPPPTSFFRSQGRGGGLFISRCSGALHFSQSRRLRLSHFSFESEPTKCGKANQRKKERISQKRKKGVGRYNLFLFIHCDPSDKTHED
jgi:hypothetical protein